MNDDTVSSIEKALIILESLAEKPYEYKSQELAKKLGLNRSTVYRVLRTLEARHFVVYDSKTDKFKIGSAAYHLGSTYLYNNNYQSKIHEIFAEITDIIKESIGIAIRDGDRIISIFGSEIRQPMKCNISPGSYFPINKGCYGKCLMAYQPPQYIDAMLEGKTFEQTCPNTLTSKEALLKEYSIIRQQGYVTSIEETGTHIMGVGIPLFHEDGSIKACVAVAFYRIDGWEKKLEDIKKLLFNYKEQLERYMP